MKLTAPFHVIRDGIVFEFQPEPEGGYTVTVPALPGCVSFGESFEEALDMIHDAISGWLAVAAEEGIPVPPRFGHWSLAASQGRP